MGDDKVFYVTARDGKRVAWLDGPHATHEAALARVDQVRRWAQYFPSGAFAAFGTASIQLPAYLPATRYPPGVPTLEPWCGSWIVDGREYFDPEPVSALAAAGHPVATTAQHLAALNKEIRK